MTETNLVVLVVPEGCAPGGDSLVAIALQQYRETCAKSNQSGLRCRVPTLEAMHRSARLVKLEELECMADSAADEASEDAGQKSYYKYGFLRALEMLKERLGVK